METDAGDIQGVAHGDDTVIGFRARERGPPGVVWGMKLRRGRSEGGVWDGG